jgi:hypothetical protein
MLMSTSESIVNSGSYVAETIVNSGSYSHLSLRCTDLSSDFIKSSQTPIKFSTGFSTISTGFSTGVDKTLKCLYNNSVRVHKGPDPLRFTEITL